MQPASRIEAMGDHADDLEYPPCDAMHIIRWFFDIGPVASGGMAAAPLSHSEIDAWQRNTGVDLTAWEARMLRDLSKAYVSMSEDAKQPMCPPPWTPASELLDASEGRARIAKRVKEMLRG